MRRSYSYRLDKKSGIFISKAWLLLSLIFGVQLYFSLNSNINDPEVNILVPIVKDFIWLVVLAITWFASEKEKLEKPLLVIISVNIVFVSTVILIYYVLYNNFDITYLKWTKNFFLYSTLTYVFLHNIKDAISIKRLMQWLNYCIVASLIVSLLFFWFSAIKSSDLRMYGTYGNPTSLGLAAIAGLILTLVLDSQYMLKKYFIVFLSQLCVMYCGSISIIIMMLMAIPVFASCRFLLNDIKVKDAFTFVLKNSLILVFFLAATFNASNYYGVKIIGFERVRIFIVMHLNQEGQLWSSDSIEIREKRYKKVWSEFEKYLSPNLPKKILRYDSSLIFFFTHFGLPGLLILYLPFLIIGYYFFMDKVYRKKIPDKKILCGILVFLALIVLLNIPIQHQTEIFPANFLIALFVGSSLFLIRQSDHA